MRWDLMEQIVPEPWWDMQVSAIMQFCPRQTTERTVGWYRNQPRRSAAHALIDRGDRINGCSDPIPLIWIFADDLKLERLNRERMRWNKYILRALWGNFDKFRGFLVYIWVSANAMPWLKQHVMLRYKHLSVSCLKPRLWTMSAPSLSRRGIGVG
jgi:hypothetical protein